MTIYSTRTAATITAFYAEKAALESNPAHVARNAARLESDGAAYRLERRLKNIRRYLRERAARKA